MSLPVIAFAALISAVLGYARLLAWRHARNARRLQQSARATERVEPYALGLLDGDAVLPDGDDVAAMSGLLTSMAPSMTGEPRQAIAEYFLANGELEAALDGLAHRRWTRRAGFAAALGDMCHSRGEQPLIAALADPRAEVRLAAARSLGRLQSAEAVEPLVAAVTSGAIPRAVGTAALLAIGPAALDVSRELATAADAGRAELGVELLGRLGSAEDLSALGRHLTHPSKDVRAGTCRALGRLGDPSVSDPLTAMLGDPAPLVRQEAAEALGAVGTPAAAAALIQVAQTDELDVALAAAGAAALLAPDLTAGSARHVDASPALRQVAGMIHGPVA